MDYKTIVLEKKEGIATITLNRPHRSTKVDTTAMKPEDMVYGILEILEKQ